MGNVRFLVIGLIIIFIAVSTGKAGEMPAIVLQNEHQSLSADFIGDVTSGQAPLKVSFFDRSTGSPGEWLWDFGDGIQDIRQNPEHTFTTPGLYSVSLSITGPSGSDRKTRLGYISILPAGSSGSIPEPKQNDGVKPVFSPDIPVSQVLSLTPAPTPIVHESPVVSSSPTPSSSVTSQQPPVETSQTDLLNLINHPVHADYTVSTTSGKAPLTVLFTDTSTGGGVSRVWDFGDGNTSDHETPEHTYETPGMYTVRLTVQGGQGSDTALRHDLIEVTTDPIASFTALPRNGSVPLTVGFVDQSTGRIDSREWNFGDGTGSNETSPTHMYTNPGVYRVSLAINGPDGTAEKQDPDPITVTQTIQEPRATILTDVTSGTVPLKVQFTDSSSGDVTTRTWDFGEGSTASEGTVSHTFASPGLHPVSLLIKGPGGESRADVLITASEPDMPDTPLVASFTADKSEGKVPLTVVFTDTSSGNVTTRMWDFGDGSSSSEKNPLHEFTVPGSYTVMYTVSGPAGDNSSTSTISAGEPGIVQTAPVAGFTTGSTSGLAPLTVVFNDTSSGDITRREWVFGDGSTSTDQHPTHEYTIPGVYHAQLTVTGPGGESKSSTSIAVQKNSEPTLPPVAGFTTDLTEGTAPLSVRFHDTSSGDITGWEWVFGDGSTSSDQHPVHEYTVPGSYNAILTVAGSGGKSNTSTPIFVLETPVPVSPPVAGFTADPSEGTVPLSVGFHDTSSGDITGWKWVFGDGDTSTQQHPTHEYSTPGSYTAVLTVTGSGGEGQFEKTISVKKSTSPPVASFKKDISEGKAPLTIVFTDISSGEITSRDWNFGDGTTSEEQNPSHTYYQPGVYYVVLTVTGQDGESKADSTVTVNNPDTPDDLTVMITPDRYEGAVPLTVSFAGTATGEITDWSWDFGDQITSIEQHPLHTYTDPGSYAVTLLVKGPAGVRRADTVIFANHPEIQAEEKLKADFSAPTTEGAAPFIISLRDTSTGNITSYAWDFGDGSTSAEQNPKHTYMVPGTYPVVLTVTGPAGESRTDASLILVTHEQKQPWAEITVNKSRGEAPLMVSFTDSSTGDISSWAWDFGDGTISDKQNPEHVFSTPGTYTVTLVVTGPGGAGKADTSILVTAPEPEPVASFNVSSSKGEAPLTVSFNDSSTGNITRRTWDFGDKTGVPEQNPVHTFQEPGIYTVALSVFGPGGFGYTERNITVTTKKSPPERDISAKKTNGVVPFRVQLHPVISGPVDGYLWDLGDGTVSYDKEPVHIYETPGVYSVKLTISGRDGVYSIVKPGFITARKEAYPPNATISAVPLSGPAPLGVTFTATADEPVDGYEWLFGDGETGTGEKALHTYGEPGTYDITLIATGPGGSDTEISPAYITVTDAVVPLHASVMATPETGVVPLNVTFTSIVTGKGDTYLWNFGDNSTTTEVTPIHVYNKTGSYPVMLTINGPDGNYSASLKSHIVVSPVTNPPVATISADVMKGTAPLHTTLSADINGTADGYVWDFGDGSSSYEINPTHAYAIPGNYTVRLTISGPKGTSEARLHDPIVVLAGDKIPVTGFTATPVSGYAPLNVSFTDTSTGTITSRNWKFGDNSESQEANPVHQYQKPGMFTVILQTSGQAGRSEEKKEGLITVQELPKPPVARFNADKRSGRPPLTVSLQDHSTGEISSWIWDLGDGNLSTEQNPVKTYTRPGVYTINETVIGPGGDDSAIRRGYIIVSAAVKPPSAAIYAEPIQGTAPLTVRFLDLSEGSISGWNWDFGDGSTSPYKNPTHFYQEPGTYKVLLKVTNPEGESVSETIIRISSANDASGRQNRTPGSYVTPGSRYETGNQAE